MIYVRECFAYVLLLRVLWCHVLYVSAILSLFLCRV